MRISAAAEARRPAIRVCADEARAAAPSDVRARSWSCFDRAFSRRLGEAGFLGLTLPRRYGGGEKGAFARFVLVEELLSAGAPVAAHWIADPQSAPLILTYATEAQTARSEKRRVRTECVRTIQCRR